jgi:hypothetical protein
MAQITGPNTKEYISSLSFMDQRDYLSDVLDITNESATMVDALEVTGRTRVTKVPTYIHTENVLLFKACVIQGLSATAGRFGLAAGDPVDFTITTTLNTFPVVGEQAMFQNKKQGIVTTSNTATGLITVTPLGTSGVANNLNIASSIANAQNVIFFSAALGEGSDDPTARRSEWIKSSNNVQIIKEAGEITDLQKVSTVEVKYNDKNYILYKVQMDALNRQKMKISNALTFGRQSISLGGGTVSGTGGSGFNDALGNQVYTTQGLRPHIFGGDGAVKLTGGQTQLLSAAVAKTDYKALFRALDRKQAPKEYWGYLGGDLYADTDDLFASGTGTNTGLGLQYAINFSSFGDGDSKKRAIDLGFDSIRIYGRTVHLNRMPLLDHAGLFGATGFDFSKEGYFIPCDKIKVDGGSGTQDRMMMRYMAGDGHDFGAYQEAVTGKLAPIPTNSKSVLHISYESVVGLHVCGTEHFAAIYWTA